MATDTLVETRIEEGRKLIELLVESGFDVMLGAWVRTIEDDQWFLYLVSDVVEREGMASAYRKLYSIYRSIPDGWVLLSDTKLIGPSNPIAKDLLEIQGRFPAPVPVRSRRPRLGNLSIEEVYVYPPATAGPGGVRQSFTVHYVRRGEGNLWRATIEHGSLYRGINASGAVAYSTARRAGENEKDEKFALVSVLLEVNPKFVDEQNFVHPVILETIHDQVWKVADERFKQYHPDAEIEHSEKD
jgi:hypothetical protein